MELLNFLYLDGGAKKLSSSIVTPKEKVQCLGPSMHQNLLSDQRRSEFINFLSYHFIQSSHTRLSFLPDDFLLSSVWFFSMGSIFYIVFENI